MAETGVVEREIRIAAPPEAVFAYFTDPERLVRWMGREATIDSRPGGGFRIRYNDTDVASGRYVAVEPPHRLSFTWAWEAADGTPRESGLVEVTLLADGEGTLLRLVHSGLDAEEARSHAEGWDHFLPQLIKKVEERS